MADWANNWAVIEGSKEDISWVRGSLVGLDDNRVFSEFDFDQLYPTPEGEGWYEWRLENWGTKWNGGVGEVLIETPTMLFLSFETAWSAPFALYEHLESREDSRLTIAAVGEDIFAQGWPEGVSLYGDVLSKCEIYIVAEDEDGEEQEIPYREVSKEMAAAMGEDPVSYRLVVSPKASGAA